MVAVSVQSKGETTICIESSSLLGDKRHVMKQMSKTKWVEKSMFRLATTTNDVRIRSVTF